MIQNPQEKLISDGKRLVMIAIAAFIFALDIKIFVRVGNLFPGGVTGMAVLIQRIFDKYWNIAVPYTPINIALNIFPAYIGFRFIGKRFTFFSVTMIVLNSVFVDALPIMTVTDDPLLIAVFGGMLAGLAISICLHADATSGGTDFIAIYLSQKNGTDSFNVILGFNVVLLTVAGALFGWENALYSIVFQFVSTQVIHVLYRVYQYETLLLITSKPHEVTQRIYDMTRHGATIIDGKGAYENENRSIVYSIIAASELGAVIRAAKEIDPDAFINTIRSDQLYGSFYLRPRD